MASTSRYYAIDRLEGNRAILIGDEREQVELAMTSLPFRVREGMVLSVPLGPDGTPEWFRAARDEAEERRRLEEGEERLERLRRRDPGGDITL